MGIFTGPQKRYIDGIYAKLLALIGAGGGSGTVTSVGLSMPSEFAVSGSPVTASGTLAAAKADQPANAVWAGPAGGAAGPPGFRGLAAGDLPVFAAVKEAVSTPAISAGALALDLAAANVFKVSWNANVTALTLQNAPATGISFAFLLILTQDAAGSRTFTFPASCKFNLGSALAMDTTANKANRLLFMSEDGGATWHVNLVGKSYA